MITHAVLSPYRLTVNQIQQGKQINPDDIHKVPIQASDFQWRVILGREAPLVSHPGDDDENANTDNHVDRMHPRQSKIKGIENLSVLLKLGLLFAQLASLRRIVNHFVDAAVFGGLPKKLGVLVEQVALAIFGT